MCDRVVGPLGIPTYPEQGYSRRCGHPPFFSLGRLPGPQGWHLLVGAHAARNEIQEARCSVATTHASGGCPSVPGEAFAEGRRWGGDLTADLAEQRADYVMR